MVECLNNWLSACFFIHLYCPVHYTHSYHRCADQFVRLVSFWDALLLPAHFFTHHIKRLDGYFIATALLHRRSCQCITVATDYGDWTNYLVSVNETPIDSEGKSIGNRFVTQDHKTILPKCRKTFRFSPFERVARSWLANKVFFSHVFAPLTITISMLCTQFARVSFLPAKTNMQEMNTTVWISAVWISLFSTAAKHILYRQPNNINRTEKFAARSKSQRHTDIQRFGCAKKSSDSQNMLTTAEWFKTTQNTC